jgi:hypothetical protein
MDDIAAIDEARDNSRELRRNDQSRPWHIPNTLE